MPWHNRKNQKKQQDISKFFTKKVSEKQATIETCKRKDINSSKIASLFAKQSTKNKVAEKTMR